MHDIPAKAQRHTQHGTSQNEPWRPAGCDRIALVLQGGGALGAY